MSPIDETVITFIEREDLLELVRARKFSSLISIPRYSETKELGHDRSYQRITPRIRFGGFVADLVGYILPTTIVFEYAGTLADDLPLLQAQPLHLIRIAVVPISFEAVCRLWASFYLIK